MRKFGLLLLSTGFAWLLALQLITFMRVLARPIADAANEEIAKMSVLTGEGARAIVGRAIVSSFDDQPLFIVPGVLMLVGGLLVSARPKTPAVISGDGAET
jgi:hypothetical protein